MLLTKSVCKRHLNKIATKRQFYFTSIFTCFYMFLSLKICVKKVVKTYDRIILNKQDNLVYNQKNNYMDIQDIESLFYVTN